MVTFNKHVVTREFPWGHPDTKDTRHTRQSGTPLSSLSPLVALHAYLMCHQDQNPVHLHMKNPLFSNSHYSHDRTNHRVSSPVVEDLAMVSEKLRWRRAGCRGVSWWTIVIDPTVLMRQRRAHTLQESESTPNSVKLSELTKLHFLPF